MSSVGAVSRFSNRRSWARVGQSPMMPPRFSAPPSTRAVEAVPWSVPAGAVDPRGAAELGGHHHHGLAPGGAEAAGQAVDEGVEIGQAVGQLALAGALVGVGVEVVHGDGGHLRRRRAGS